MNTVIGIDLSGISRSTASRTVCATVSLELTPKVVELRTIGAGVDGDRELIDYVTNGTPLAVAIDAPLSLPHGVTCTESTCSACAPGGGTYLQRPADRQAKGMPLVMIAATFRGIYVATQLRHRGVEVVETYPGAIFRALGVHEARGTHDYPARAVAMTAFVAPFVWSTPDEVDAVCAALAAASWLRAGRPSRAGEIWMAT